MKQMQSKSSLLILKKEIMSEEGCTCVDYLSRSRAPFGFPHAPFTPNVTLFSVLHKENERSL